MPDAPSPIDTLTAGQADLSLRLHAMRISDDQLLDLESYLDGALNPSEIDVVRARLTVDTDWSESLSTLKAERALRRLTFAALEPSEREADQFSTNLVSDLRRRQNQSKLWRGLRVIAAAAACLMFGLIGGWMLRDRAIAIDHNTTGSKVAVSSPAGHGETKVAKVVSYQVELTDENGRVTAVQTFDSLDKAKEFADDLSHWQERQSQLRNGSAIVVADRF